ncbi:MAG: DNA-binding protein [Saprospiraceae bacterium]|nr:DNA-binding protein [Saprospiraceae bacterium]MCB0625992.1 DNA-binding protein [Saprospiraceae bacterium]
MKTHAFRLRPGDDLKAGIIQVALERKVEAGIILTCVGSLRRAHLRFADQLEGTLLREKFEIVSLEGTVSAAGVHLHLALSDADGGLVGGHLLEGCLVHTTAEVVIGELQGVRFVREVDLDTGYQELTIYEEE